MPGSSLLGRRRTLVLGFLAVTASLALLLALQYVWLQRLRDMTALAHRAAMDTFVSSVGAEVEFFYRSAAERCLRVPDRLFSDTEVAIAKYWSEVPRDGIRDAADALVDVGLRGSGANCGHPVGRGVRARSGPGRSGAAR